MRRAGTLLVLLLAGCGATAHPGTGHISVGYNPHKAAVAACAHAGRPIPLPAAFPGQFPFPPGTVLDRTAQLNAAKHQIGIYGFVPSSSFPSTVNFFKRMVVAKGFKRLYFEVDSPHDSEGTYKGFGKVGVWRLEALPGCPKAMNFSASAEPAK